MVYDAPLSETSLFVAAPYLGMVNIGKLISLSFRLWHTIGESYS